MMASTDAQGVDNGNDELEPERHLLLRSASDASGRNRPRARVTSIIRAESNSDRRHQRPHRRLTWDGDTKDGGAHSDGTSVLLGLDDAQLMKKVVSWVGLEPIETRGVPINDWNPSSLPNTQLVQESAVTTAPGADGGPNDTPGQVQGNISRGSSVSSSSKRPQLMSQSYDNGVAGSQRLSSLNGTVPERGTPPAAKGTDTPSRGSATEIPSGASCNADPPTPPPVLSSTELLSLERSGSVVENGSTVGDDQGVEMGPLIRPLTMEEVERMALPGEPTPPPDMTTDDVGFSSGLLQACPAPDSGKIPSRQKFANVGISQGMSAMYGKLLVVLGFAFPLSEVLSSHIPYSFYEGFYLYLYVGCIVFLLFVYAEILVTKRRDRFSDMSRAAVSTLSMDSFYSFQPDQQTVIDPETGRVLWMAKPSIHYGSFYLRLGTVAFGVGNMIYSGLEVGQYLEHQEDDECYTLLIAITPACRIVFTFIQMYFIFLNSKMLISRFTTLARFGLMHMIATNLCIWLYVLVEESKHELLEGHHTILKESSADIPSHYGGPSMSSNWSANHLGSPVTIEVHGSAGHNEGSHASADAGVSLGHLVSHGAIENQENPLTQSLVGSGPHSIHECLRTNIMGELVQNASPFLFPCVIEYSLICAAILYVMWKNVAPESSEEGGEYGGEFGRHRSGMVRVSSKRSRHHYSMDCAGANRGLFTGIIILVFTIISLILFFVLINREEMQDVAVFEANVSELVLYLTSAVASIIGMARMRRLRYDSHRNLELDSILLIIAQTGLFLYSIFIVIGGYFTMYNRATSLMLVTGLTMLGQCILQTMFILDASRRYAHNSAHAREKPGREFVTFLIVSNLAMWAINTLETSRANAHPVHLRFFGEWAWTIIVHISMPLAIFYRFHSTVCLCEVWTKAYKTREMRHADSVAG